MKIRIRNTANSYGIVTKTLHWLIALAIIFMLCLGFLMHTSLWYTLHKSLGITILLLMILRVIWTLCNPSPVFPKKMPLWMRIAARLTHSSLYVLALLMPFSGWLMSSASGRSPQFWWWFKWSLPWVSDNRNLARLSHSLHELLAWVLIAVILLHTLASLKHHFIDKDGILKRML